MSLKSLYNIFVTHKFIIYWQLILKSNKEIITCKLFGNKNTSYHYWTIITTKPLQKLKQDYLNLTSWAKLGCHSISKNSLPITNILASKKHFLNSDILKHKAFHRFKMSQNHQELSVAAGRCSDDFYLGEEEFREPN